MTREERFWARVNKTETCWLWTAGIFKTGYGSFFDARGSRKTSRTLYAHRVSYELAVGPIPDGMEIDHICHVRRCVNPAHLRAVTHKQNLENRSGSQQNSPTQTRGVHWDKQRSKWRISVGHNGKYHFSRYNTFEEAVAAVQAKRLELFTHSDMDRIEDAS